MNVGLARRANPLPSGSLLCAPHRWRSQWKTSRPATTCCRRPSYPRGTSPCSTACPSRPRRPRCPSCLTRTRKTLVSEPPPSSCRGARETFWRKGALLRNGYAKKGNGEQNFKCAGPWVSSSLHPSLNSIRDHLGEVGPHSQVRKPTEP